MKNNYTFTKTEKPAKKKLYREELEPQIEAFLKSGGHIQKLDANIESTPKVQTMQNTGGLLS